MCSDKRAISWCIRSDDDGVTWTTAAKLTEGQSWHQSACNVHYANGCVYLVMERRVTGTSRRGRSAKPRRC